MLKGSSAQIQKKQGSMSGRSVSKLSGKTDSFSHQISSHIQMHQELEKRILELKTGDGDVPKEAFEVLEESSGVIRDVSEKVSGLSLPIAFTSDKKDAAKKELAPSSEVVIGQDSSNLAKLQESMTAAEVMEVLKDIPGISQDKISIEFVQEALGKNIESDTSVNQEVNSMLESLGIDLETLTQTDLKELRCLMLISKYSDNPSVKQEVNSQLLEKVYPKLIEHYANAEDYEEKVEEHFQGYLQQFGLTLDQLASDDDNKPPLKELLFVQSMLRGKLTPIQPQLNSKINNRLKPILQQQFNAICNHLKTLDQDAPDLNHVEENVVHALAILHHFADYMPFTPEKSWDWDEIVSDFGRILQIKADANTTVENVMTRVFQQFHSFIEDGVMKFYLEEGGGMSAEEVTQKLYGRTHQEMEEIKTTNRAAVAEKINELADRVKAGEPLTVNMLLELHATNNRGIVPSYLSALREKPSETVIFGVREGLEPQFVKPAVEEVFDKANTAITKSKHTNRVSRRNYAVKVGALHNRLLDIHPFLDRNGSTAVLFVELMMTVKGYHTPSPNRSTDYYQNIRSILHSKTATGVVGYEHYKIAHRPGKYKKYSE